LPTFIMILTGISAWHRRSSDLTSKSSSPS
jgi:hypothetical protein